MVPNLIYILICLTSFCNTSKENDRGLVNQVTIYYIYSLTDTQHDVSCQDFDAYRRQGSLMIKELQSKVQIDLFMRSLKRCKAPTLVKRIDVRAKSYIRYIGGKTSMACIDRFGDIMLDGKFVGVSSSLLLFLKKNCDGFE
jgi:hypothetical protein